MSAYLLQGLPPVKEGVGGVRSAGGPRGPWVFHRASEDVLQDEPEDTRGSREETEGEEAGVACEVAH